MRFDTISRLRLAKKPEYVPIVRGPYVALALALRDRTVERWIQTQETYYERDSKRIDHLSLEYLMGRTLVNSVTNLGLVDECV